MTYLRDGRSAVNHTLPLRAATCRLTTGGRLWQQWTMTKRIATVLLLLSLPVS